MTKGLFSRPSTLAGNSLEKVIEPPLDRIDPTQAQIAFKHSQAIL